MRAVLNKAAGMWETEEVEEPIAAADEVLVAVKACGICGSEALHK